MKQIIPILICLYPSLLMGQANDTPVQGRVITASDSLPLPGASVTIKGTHTGTITDPEGRFTLSAPEGAVLVISYIGYAAREMAVNAATSLTIALEEDYLTLGGVEIYSTGYQELPAERATGSFEHVDNELLNRSTGTDVISRLEGVTNSLLFDRSTDKIPGENAAKLRIRGLSTMYGTGVVSDKEAPLIVVDNFPFEGDINNINPNDIESITILKDAASASIWGARAGNGVIVITTKRGGFDQPVKISFNSNVTIQQKPDLYYSPDYLTSSDFIAAERYFFDQGYYSGDENSNGYPVLSEAVEIFIQERDGEISSSEADERLAVLEQIDVRKDIEKYLYRNALDQQYALNVSGGSERFTYYLSGGLDKKLAATERDKFNRITFNTLNSFRPVKQLEFTFGMYYTQNHSEDNGMSIADLNHYSKSNYLPYTRLADDAGMPLPIAYQYRSAYVANAQADGLLNWQYRPLEELELNDNQYSSKENRFNIGLKYTITEGLNIDLKYQYQTVSGGRELLKDKGKYQVRDLVNRFTQPDGTQVFPHAAILRKENDQLRSSSGRLQINYNKMFSPIHQIAVLAGMEMREVQKTGHSFETYGYDPDILTHQTLFDYTSFYPVRPRYSARIPAPYYYFEDYLDRYVSYYGNASYTYDGKYILSGSIRWDASNLFGVKTNQKGVPLWSAGGSWLAHKEDFFNVSWLPMLKVRGTFGYNGNIDKGATAFTTARYRTDNLTDLPNATIMSPGNPQLQWEKVNIINAGIDFSLRKNVLSGSIEFYRKNSVDLIGPVPLNPTTGFLNRFNVNYASLLTKGVDIELNSEHNIKGIKWQITTLINYAKDKVTDFQWDGESQRGWYLQNASLPVVNRSLYTLYSLPWVGLDPATGDPLVMIEGVQSTDYAAYFDQLDPATDLIAHGSKIPPYFGALRNTFTWRGFSLSANITWKAGHFFRRSALSYYQLYNNWEGHEEFASRWRQPGDEKITDVPSLPTGPLIANRDNIYIDSEQTVEKGDHIRLQDISLSYEIKSKIPERIRIYGYARNLGIIWRANDKGLDPDYPSAYYPPAKTFALGVQIEF